MIDTHTVHRWLFDKQGNNLTLAEFARLMDEPSYYRVAGTVIGGKIWVSTIWLGSDYTAITERTLPRVFETMVFPIEEGKEDLGIGRRYATEAQAMTGHLEIVEDVAQYLNLPVEGDHIKTDQWE